MRISSGIYKGRKLIVPKAGLRPTTDMARQAIINIVRPKLRGAVFLDLYAGTGSVGIEALSNGAEFVYFVENNLNNYNVLKKNLSGIIEDKSKYSAIKRNAADLNIEMFDKAYPPFGIIFADPFYKDTLKQIDNLFKTISKLMDNNGIFILEHENRIDLSYLQGFKETKKYGGTCLSIFENEVLKK